MTDLARRLLIPLLFVSLALFGIVCTQTVHRSGLSGSGPPIKVIVENHNYQDSSVDIHCISAGKIETIYYVATSHKKSKEIRSDCREMTLVVDLVGGQSRYWASDPLRTQPGDCWKLVVGPRLWQTAVYPCHRA